jgi:thiamine pyrophosphate-dependent acetolactate synthase large subunit-like protein
VISRIDAIKIIADHVDDDELVISTTGMISREFFVTQDRPGNFYMLGSMGLASSFGLGLALLNPNQRVVVIEGDGSTLMSMGTLALIASEAPPNFLHIILDNESYESTGAQPSITGQIDLAEIAASCGYRHAERVEGAEQLARALTNGEGNHGPRLILAKVGIAPVKNISRVTHTPVAIRDQFHGAVAQNMA